MIASMKKLHFSRKQKVSSQKECILLVFSTHPKLGIMCSVGDLFLFFLLLSFHVSVLCLHSKANEKIDKKELGERVGEENLLVTLCSC